MENNLTWQERGVNARGHHREVKDFPRPKTSLLTTIDFGETIELENFAQITSQTLPIDLLERQIVAVVNFPKNKLVSS
jgi:tRNA-binding EMAP/Myf-like protein